MTAECPTCRPEADDGAPCAGHSRWWHGLGAALLVFVGTRLIVWVAAYSGAALHVQILNRVEPPIQKREKQIRVEMERPDSPLARDFREYVAGFRPMLNWDAGHYWSIVDSGYEYQRPPPGTPFGTYQANIAFFPLYPWLCSLIKPLVGVPGSLVLVANLAALIAAILMYGYVRDCVDARAALAATAITFCWPTACFYSFGYPESLNLALTIACLWLADRNRPVWAALACGLATATRPTAIVLVPILLLVYWLRSPASRGRRLLAGAGLAPLAAGGAIAYAVYLAARFGSPSVYVENLRAGWIPPLSEGQWGGFLGLEHVVNGFRLLWRAVKYWPAGMVELGNPIAWNIPVTLAVLGLSVWGLWRAPARFRPYLLLGPLIFAQRYLVAGWSSFGVESMSRYVMLAVPAMIVLGVWLVRGCRPAVRTALVAILLLLQANWAFRFGLSDWAG